MTIFNQKFKQKVNGPTINRGVELEYIAQQFRFGYLNPISISISFQG